MHRTILGQTAGFVACWCVRIQPHWIGARRTSACSAGRGSRRIIEAGFTGRDAAVPVLPVGLRLIIGVAPLSAHSADSPSGASVGAGKQSRLDPLRLTQSGDFRRFVQQIGRPPDASDQGGACGGIVIHDWVSENLRVIELGGRIQSVSPVRRDR